MCTQFETVRDGVLAQARDAEVLRNDVAAMRTRMRTELDRSSAALFDLKQGEAGLVDLEFLLQWLVLDQAVRHPALAVPRDTPGLLRAACDAGLFDAGDCTALAEAHATLLDVGLRCTLDRRARITTETDAIELARAAIRTAAQRKSLTFD